MYDEKKEEDQGEITILTPIEKQKERKAEQ